MSRDWRSDEPKKPRPFNSRYPAVALTLLPRMRTYLEGRGLSFAVARHNGWYPSWAANPRYESDGYPRVVIPATSHQTGNVYWQARDMSGTDPRRYLCPAAPSGDAIVVVWPPMDLRDYHSVVCEGPMDALASAELGYIGVALMGLPVAPEALDLTAELLRGTMCTLVGDSDALSQMTEILMALLDRQISSRLVEPAPYKDLAEAPLEIRRQMLA